MFLDPRLYEPFGASPGKSLNFYGTRQVTVKYQERCASWFAVIELPYVLKSVAETGSVIGLAAGLISSRFARSDSGF